jgi:hypothetical protein
VGATHHYGRVYKLRYTGNLSGGTSSISLGARLSGDGLVALSGKEHDKGVDMV